MLLRGMGPREAGVSWGAGPGGFYLAIYYCKCTALQLHVDTVYNISSALNVPGRVFQFYGFTRGKIITTRHYFFHREKQIFYIFKF